MSIESDVLRSMAERITAAEARAEKAEAEIAAVRALLDDAPASVPLVAAVRSACEIARADLGGRLAAAEAERDAAIVAGAVAVHALREALKRHGRHAEECATRKLCPQDRPLPTCDCGINAALKADGGGDVRYDRHGYGCPSDGDELRQPCDVCGELKTPPALPDPTAALAAFARSVIEACADAIVRPSHVVDGAVEDSPGGTIIRALDPADIARRWMEGER